MMKKIICIGLLLVMVFSFAACAEPQKRGDFYTLQEAFDQGLITIDDLKNIAYHLNGESPDENFVPTPKNPETLSAKTEKAIKETRAYYYRNILAGVTKDAKPSGFTIEKYMGTYNNAIAVLIISSYHTYLCIVRTETIEECSVYIRK